ncbi:MAG: GDSL-type esterase/lipase family protein [Roseburia sp.]|nr:GDSL-type esterase/lipase family protein [Roseburia sp.]MCM1097968.1 GDSL-type esterase/lipase family protein [Ruminococcus flavefaciens]
MVIAGILYFSYVDHWQVYAESMERAGNFYRMIFGEPGGPGADGNAAGSQSGIESNGFEAGGPDEVGNSGGSGADGSAAGSQSGIESNGSEAGGPDEVGNSGGPGADGSAAGNQDGTGTGDSEAESHGGISNPDSTESGENGPGSGGDGQPNGAGADNPVGTASGNTGYPNGTASGNTGYPNGTASGNSAQPGENAPREFVTVEDDYFADAVFIGDSRTVGMYEYGGLEEISTFYASKGLTIYKIFDSEIVKVPGQKQKITIEEALQQNTFSRIYLMIGINEMGTGTVETFIEKYKEVVAHLQELQPEADLFIQGIIKVTTERSEKGDYINNEGIEARNAELEKLADGQKIFYLDVNPLICDETGGMEPSYTFDGVHLKAQYIEIWKNFLKEHAIQ